MKLENCESFTGDVVLWLPNG